MTTFMWTWGVDNDDYFPLRAFGVDVVRAGSPNNPTLFQTQLDNAQFAGVKLLASIMYLSQTNYPSRTSYTQSELDAIGAVIDQFDGHPALYGWETFDEPSYRCKNAPRIQLYNYIKTRSNKPVVEVDYTTEDTTCYSPLSHDIFVYDRYTYYYADQWKSQGCVDKTTGLITSQAAENNAYSYWQTEMAKDKVVLDADGKPYFVLMQGFHNVPSSTEPGYGPVPIGGFTKMWNTVVSNGMQGMGAGYYGWQFGGTRNVGLFDTNGPWTYNSSMQQEASDVLWLSSDTARPPYDFDVDLTQSDTFDFDVDLTKSGLPLYIGSQQVQKLYIGSQEVIHLYKGSTQIF